MKIPPKLKEALVAPSMELVDEAFALDVEVITDGSVTAAGRACTTNDGCDPSCASSCVSNT